jgi:acetylornithine/N-succinyldiaminopimelate aminotransferase
VSAAVAEALRQAGFLVNPIQPDVIRLAPPLILTADQVDAFLTALPAALTASSAAADDDRQGGPSRTTSSTPTEASA